MKKIGFSFTVALLAGAILSAQAQTALPASTPGAAATPLYPALPSETPDEFKAPVDSFDYVKRSVMIPMRDGVKLNTVIIVPRKASRAPILLTRTPYNAVELTSHA